MARPEAALSPDTFSSFGSLLRHLRLRTHLTLRELAIAVGYSEGYLSRLEHGERLPDIAMVRARFVAALDLADDPVWANRLIVLATAARTSPPADAAHHRVVAGAQATEPDAGEPRVAPLLGTKLYPPAPRRGDIVRPRLRALLSDVHAVPLTVVAAPAGWGKTSLVSQWLSESRADPVRFCWLTLEAGDDDLATFLRYLVAALRTAAPSVGTTTLALLRLPRPPVAVLLTALLNDLLLLSEDHIVVLDDYHVITSPAIHDALTFLVEHLPPALHLVVAGREEPCLPLPRLRAHGRLLELGAHELRFTPDEAAAFLTECMGLRLTGVEVATLDARMDGWIAGLQLAALALRNRDRQPDLAGVFNRPVVPLSHEGMRFVTDYLAGEVLERLPAHLQLFLAHTAILERLCGPLCDAVIGVDTSVAHHRSGRDMLAELERMNLFVMPLDDARVWYRYHPVFAEAVRASLVDDTLRTQDHLLHRRASQWFEDHNGIGDAIRHALAAGDTARAVQVIEQRAEPFLERTDTLTLMPWMTLLPPALIREHPALCLIQAMCASSTFDLDAIEPLLQAAERATLPAAGVGRHWLGHVAETARLVRASRASASGDHALALELSVQAVDAGPNVHPFLHAWALWQAGTTAWIVGDLLLARQSFDTLHTAYAATYPALYVQAALGLSVDALVYGRLQEARRICEQALHAAQRDRWSGIPMTGALALRLGMLYYEVNDLHAAQRYAQQAIAMASEFEGPALLTLGYLLLAQIERVVGTETDSPTLRRGLEQIAPGVSRSFISFLVTDHYVGFGLMQGDADVLDQWIELGEPSNDGQRPYARRLVEAQIRLQRGQPDSAARLVVQGLAAATAAKQTGLEIGWLVLQARLHAQLGKRARATEMLERALALAEPEGYVRTFADAGPSIVALLRDLATRHAARSAMDRVLAAIKPSAPQHAPEAVSAAALPRRPVTAPTLLSGREQEILQLIAAGSSNQTIAHHLAISGATVKRHVSNILRKLDVANRTAAVARARELNLL